MKAAFALAAIALLAPAVAASEPVKVERDSDLLEFSFEWSSEAAAIPSLDSRFRADMSAAFGQAEQYAREDKALTREQERDFNRHYYSAAWETAGQSQRLLSLEGTIETFTGGAHPNHDFKAILWDRSLDRQVGVADLFAVSEDFETLTRTAYCAALDRERLDRREGEKLGGEFDECPKFSDLAIAPVDDDKNGRFETIDFVAPPYVAGPYAEGEYVVALPVTEALIGALKPDNRPSFEPQRPQ